MTIDDTYIRKCSIVGNKFYLKQGFVFHEFVPVFNIWIGNYDYKLTEPFRDTYHAMGLM